MVRNFWPIRIMLIYVFFCNIIKVNYFRIALLYYYIWFLLPYILDFYSYVYFSIKLIDSIILWSLKRKATFLISSLKTLCLSLLNLCCVSLLVFINFVWSSLRLSALISFFSKWLVYFQFELLLNSFYNLQI